MSIQCPMCKGTGRIEAEAKSDSLLLTLRYMIRENKPLFNGPFERGLNELEFWGDDSDMKTMILTGLIERKGNEGWIVTAKGRALVGQ